MKKIVVIMLSAVIIFMMSGCKADKPTINQEESPIPTTSIPTTATPIPTQGVPTEAVEEDTSQLQPGFDTWEQTAAVKALNKVLVMDEPVNVVSMQDLNAGKVEYEQYYLNKIYHFLDYSFDQNLTPNQYAIIDLDQDSTPEVVVRLSLNYDDWVMILRYFDGKVYGYSIVSRGFESPKTNGTYIASSGAFDNKIMQLSFEGIILKENTLGASTLVNENMEYYIGENKVTEEEYDKFNNDFYNSEDAKWYLFPSEIRADYNGERLFYADFEAVTQPMGKELGSYYSGMENEKTFSHSSRIPLELHDLVVEAMKSETEEEVFGPLKVGTELSQEEFCNLTGMGLEETEDIIPLRVDADNDGIQDLIGLFYWGGTGGFSSMELYQGTENEKYTSSNSFDCFYQTYDFISYEGKNYLLMMSFDYNTKYYSGYTIYLYENGILADGMSFWFEIQDYNREINYENSSFAEIEQIKNTLSNKELPKVLDNNDGVIYGTGEKIDGSSSTGYLYSSDIDNDGKLEKYNKSMWYPSNMGTVMQCTYDFENSNVLEDLCARLADEVGEGRLYTFWIDKIEEENIMYLYYGNNLDYSLYAYRLTRME